MMLLFLSIYINRVGFVPKVQFRHGAVLDNLITLDRVKSCRKLFPFLPLSLKDYAMTCHLKRD